MQARYWLIGVLTAASGLAALAQGTRESVTVIRPGPGGNELQIIQSEQTTDDAAQKVVNDERQRPKDPKTAVESDAPRKARVMVAPAIFAQERRRRIDRLLNERFGITDPGVIENPGFTSYIIDALVNTRKFDMLEREELKTLIREMEFGESEFADPAKIQQIGKMAGADYVIVPEIRYLETDNVQRDVPYVGGSQNSFKTKLATSIRTVDVGTGRIISSSIDEVEKSGRARQGSSVRITVMDLIAECFKETAMKEAAVIVDVAYPIRIMSIDGNTVMLNRGKGAILTDEILQVYSAGEVMIDPDTGDNLGYQEAYVGKLRVVSVEQKTSKAEIVEKEAPILRLYLCRRVAPPTRESTIKTQPPPKID